MATMDIGHVFKILQSLSVKSLRRTRDFVDKLIHDKVPDDRQFISGLDINDFVNYHEDFASDSECNGLMNDFLEVAKLKESGTQSIWFSREKFPYSWHSQSSGITTKNRSFDIDSNSTLMSVMKKVNSKFGTSLNSCLVQYYPNGHSGVRLHDDLEPEMTMDAPIAVITVGCCRQV